MSELDMLLTPLPVAQKQTREFQFQTCLLASRTSTTQGCKVLGLWKLNKCGNESEDVLCGVAETWAKLLLVEV